ncbi:MAG TPA: YecA family protein [Caldimonas sp.]
MSSRPPRPVRRAAQAARRPLGDAEIGELQALLDAVPAPLDPLDVSMLDGFLCGVLVQPEPVAPARWLRHVTDVDGRPLPAAFDAARLRELVGRRHAELDDAIARRQWFDPWVFELDDPECVPAPDRRDNETAPAIDAVVPWVAGFATALELFPALLRCPAATLNEPLALLYRHLPAEDIEDADDLLVEIDALEPAVDLGEAVEGLVRATLLLADVARSLRAPRL